MIDKKQFSDAGDAAGLPPHLSRREILAAVTTKQDGLADPYAVMRAGTAVYLASEVEARVRALEAEVESLNETVTQGAAAYAELRVEIVALEAERDEAREDLESQAWPRVLKVGAMLLEQFYPPDIFTGESGDPGPTYVVALRDALKRQSIAEAERAALLPQWQPIETAPTDGTPILAGEIRDGQIKWLQSAMLKNGIWRLHDFWFALDAVWVERLTHWMPMPAPLGAAGRSARPQLLAHEEDTRGDKGVGSRPIGSTAPAD